MKRTFRRIVVFTAVAGSFVAGRASGHRTDRDAIATAKPQAGASPATPGQASARPWAAQGFRGEECQIIGDIPECS